MQRRAELAQQFRLPLKLVRETRYNTISMPSKAARELGKRARAIS
jgi:hypothetical protein